MKRVGRRTQRIIEAGEFEGVGWRKKVVTKEQDTSEGDFGVGRVFGVTVEQVAVVRQKKRSLRSLLIGSSISLRKRNILWNNSRPFLGSLGRSKNHWRSSRTVSKFQ